MGIFKKAEKLATGDVIITEETSNIYEELMKAQVSVTFFCMTYFYNGIIEAVNGETIVLRGTRVVYETGAFSDPSFKDAQLLTNGQWFIRIPTIESFGVLNKQ
jgi:hypothetical protein